MERGRRSELYVGVDSVSFEFEIYLVENCL